MTITPGTHEYEEKLKKLSREAIINAETADFYKKTGRLHYETFSRIRRRQPETGSGAHNRTEPIAIDAAAISAHADEIKRHATALLQLLESCPSAHKRETTALADAIASGKLSPAELVSHVYHQDEAVLISFADSLGIDIELLIFFAFTCARPVCEALASELNPSDLQHWTQPACPVCGSVPFMARLLRADGQRRLSCQLYATEWIFNRLRCALCGNEKHERLEVLMVDGTPYRIDACRDCKSYIKTVDERAIQDEAYTYSAGIEDLATIHIDLIAGRKGYMKPVFKPDAHHQLQ